MKRIQDAKPYGYFRCGKVLLVLDYVVVKYKTRAEQLVLRRINSDEMD